MVDLACMPPRTDVQHNGAHRGCARRVVTAAFTTLAGRRLPTRRISTVHSLRLLLDDGDGVCKKIVGGR